MNFDVLFLGSGQGAWNGAIPMAKAGLKVGVIEEGLFGGVCTNRGCNAKITLDRPVELLRQVEQLQGRGFNGVPQLNWSDLMAHKHEVIDSLAQSNQDKLENAGVKTIIGRGTFVDSHTIEVAGENYTADKIVIVTGQLPHRLAIPGNELFHDSTDFLVLENMPKKVTIIGGGYIGMEFATMANAFGADVTVILRGDKVLREFHQDYVDILVKDLKNRGVKFHINEKLKKAEKIDEKVILTGENGYTHESDYVIDATGRRPQLKNMNFEGIGLEFDEIKGIFVNEFLETNLTGVYAAGDVLAKSQPKITPVAAYESQYLAHLFTGDTNEGIVYPPIAKTVFTSPRLAEAGISIAEAQTKPDEYKITVVDYAAKDWFHQVGNDDINLISFVHNKAGYLVGVTNLGNDAVETVNGLLDVMNAKIKAPQQEELIYLFPSIAHSYMKYI
ncbi:dihydrolipoyl dehydrogenase family protein [Enterococcus alishanensis]|uniref:NAD(P)/FAD-dependent oxidoreductase n=1 Tax=Enterococcus alishanensis TaxID=1303817 RepID=A0ABS6TDH1_9ENTE|nr:NAD(P)/FAD-dependent oxidoreductase [Enterococcus alishanensis]MBV7390963.1 NAD(P)/FAD-dependent oxidoreductase [Enterococcus alishanensis]